MTRSNWSTALPSPRRRPGSMPSWWHEGALASSVELTLFYESAGMTSVAAMESFDLLIIGGGINGTAIARDAAIHELKVILVDKDDLAQNPSAARKRVGSGKGV